MRVIVFIDAQNFYNEARRAFFSDLHPHPYGQFNPLTVGQLLCSRAPEGQTYRLEQVRVYTGRPDATRDPKPYAANLRQCTAWENGGIKVVARTLRYPLNWPKEKAQQKGIDVALAIDFIALAIDNTYDVGILASVDTDLLPALEFVHRRFYPSRRVQVASWSSAEHSRRLSLTGANIWCHWLSKDDYDAVSDLTDYNIPP